MKRFMKKNHEFHEEELNFKLKFNLKFSMKRATLLLLMFGPVVEMLFYSLGSLVMQLSLREIARQTDVSKSTVSRLLKAIP